MNCAIQVSDLHKSYGANQVLRGVSFTVNKGETFALLGVNGTGKTTTLECVEGLRKYDSGTIAVHGKMGIQLQSASLPEHILSIEAVKLFAKWNHVAVDPKMLAALGVEPLAKKQYGQLSTGQKRRLHLALALLSDPDIIFLDEPTAGLDVEGRVALHAEIRKLKQMGKTIILASHDMAEVETLCDRIAILRDGGVAFLGTVEELTSTVGRVSTVKLKTDLGEETFQSSDLTKDLLAKLTQCQSKGVEVHDIKIDRGTLEQHFINISKGEEQ